MSLTRKPAEPGGFTTFRRKPPKPSKRSTDPVTPEVHAQVMARSGGRCEAPADLHGPGGCSGRMHVHHRLPVSWGGRSDVTNLLHLCGWVHAWAHNHPVAAIVVGLLVPRRRDRDSDPGRYPVTVADGRRVLLGPDGRYEECA